MNSAIIIFHRMLEDYNNIPHICFLFTFLLHHHDSIKILFCIAQYIRK